MDAPPVSQFHRLGSYIRRAARAAHYPLYGISYFIRHPYLYPLFLSRLLPLCVISFLVYLVLFGLVFLPQLAFLVLFHGWGAWITAVVLVLGEGLVIIQGLFEGFFVDACRVDVFDSTLLEKNCARLVAANRILLPNAANPVGRLGRPIAGAPAAAPVYQPWSLVQIVELAICLPLCLVPYVGMPAFIIITGARLGKLSHYRWYKMRGLTRKERHREIRLRTWDYTWFGTVAMLLELVPVLSFFFLLTSAAGAALWVAEMEQQTPSVLPGEAPAAATDGQTGENEPVVGYEDNPV